MMASEAFSVVCATTAITLIVSVSYTGGCRHVLELDRQWKVKGAVLLLPKKAFLKLN